MYKLPHTLLRITFVSSTFYHMKQMSQSSNKRTTNGTHHLLASRTMGRKIFFHFSHEEHAFYPTPTPLLIFCSSYFIKLLFLLNFYTQSKFHEGQICPLTIAYKPSNISNQQTFGHNRATCFKMGMTSINQTCTDL